MGVSGSVVGCEVTPGLQVLRVLPLAARVLLATGARGDLSRELTVRLVAAALAIAGEEARRPHAQQRWRVHHHGPDLKLALSRRCNMSITFTYQLAFSNLWRTPGF